MAELDRVIRGGRVVAQGIDGIFDVGIHDGQVVQMGGSMDAERVLDAGGMMVLPGGVDAHVHLSMAPGDSDEPAWVDDFTSGSAAALAGGITTLGNMTFPAPGETSLDALEREGATVRQQAIADVFLHPVLEQPSDEALDQIPRLLDSGCNSLKVFTVMQEFELEVTRFVEAIARAGQSGLITLIHCEDYALIQYSTERLAKQGRATIRYYSEGSPIVSEVVATQRAVAIAEATGAPIYIVHLSSARALEVCREAQARGVQVYVETRPLYLHLTEERFEEPEAAKYAGQPPLRTEADVRALWFGIREGTVHTVCSDHAPYALADKLDPNHTLQNLRAGVENLQFLRPMLFSEGVRTGRISLARFVEVTATNAAKLFGLYPQKGTITPGGDADLVIWDPNLTRTVTHSMMKSNADYSVYEGWGITGWPAITLRRGEIVFEDDRVLGDAGSGRVLRCGPTTML